MSESTGQGFLGSLSESLRAHFDERFKSPFSGAFTVAWVAFNWKTLIVLMFSEESVELRLKLLEDSGRLDMWNILWHPLWLALVIAIAFYMLSAIFLVVRESYGVGSRRIERAFDKCRWKSPAEYIALKKRFEEQNGHLSELAADNLSKLDASQAQVAKLSETLVEQKELQVKLRDEVNTALQAKSATLDQLNGLSEELRDAEKRSVTLQMRLDLVGLAASKLAAHARAGLSVGQGISAGLVPPSLTPQDLKSSIELIEVEFDSGPFAPSGFSRVAGLKDADLEGYTKRRFPDLPVNIKLQLRVIADIAKVPQLLQDPLPQIEYALTSARDAVEAHRAKFPALFASGTDYITKSLGFCFPEFRKIHPFGEETKKAFEQWDARN